MKFPTVIALWIVAILLGVIAYFVKFHGAEDETARTELAPGEKLCENLPIRDIYGVTLTQGDQKTHLVRGEGNAWGVKERADYPIDYELLRNLLGALNSIEVTQGYPTASEYFSRFGLADELTADDEKRGYLGAIKVTMAGKDGTTLAEVAMGKYSGTSHVGGRFLRVSGDDSGVYAVAETFPGVTADPKNWLGKDFLKIDQMATISLSAPHDPAFKNWKLSRLNSQSQFTLEGITDTEVMQLTSTNALRNLLANSSFQDVLSTERVAELSQPDEKLRKKALITTFDGLSYNLEFWPHKILPKDPNADSRLPAPLPSYNLTIKVTADIPTSRNKSAAEKPEDAKMLDAQFSQLQNQAQQKFTSVKALEGRIFQVSQHVISPLQKKRSDYVKSKTTPSATSAPSLPLQPAPGQP